MVEERGYFLEKVLGLESAAVVVCGVKEIYLMSMGPGSYFMETA